MKLEFSRKTILRVYREYRESGETSNLRHRSSREKIIQERYQRRLKRIIKRSRRETLPQIAADFNAGPLERVTVQTIQRNIVDMCFWSRKQTCVSLLTARHNALRLAWAPQNQHCSVYNWKHVVGLTSFSPN
ncbi:HTH_Tnp_Tc3_2 domain-containing protein [Trichonephila clavipes]|nr:HTH_Tnp_Tc3_2 domain-containing protein [Trichonephila clavipes]